jgi:hypothetical protein
MLILHKDEVQFAFVLGKHHLDHQKKMYLLSDRENLTFLNRQSNLFTTECHQLQTAVNLTNSCIFSFRIIHFSINWVVPDPKLHLD